MSALKCLRVCVVCDVRLSVCVLVACLGVCARMRVLECEGLHVSACMCVLMCVRLRRRLEVERAVLRGSLSPDAVCTCLYVCAYMSARLYVCALICLRVYVCAYMSALICHCIVAASMCVGI